MDITDTMWGDPREILKALTPAEPGPAQAMSIVFRKCINYPRLKEASFVAWIRLAPGQPAGEGRPQGACLTHSTQDEALAVKNFLRLEASLRDCGIPFEIRKERWDVLGEIKGLKPAPWDYEKDFGRIDWDVNYLHVGSSADFLVNTQASGKRG